MAFSPQSSQLDEPRRRKLLRLPEPMLARAGALPADVQLDGELVAFNSDGDPDFHLLGERMLHHRADVPVTSGSKESSRSVSVTAIGRA